MDFDETEDQQDLRAMVREFLERRWTEADVRRQMETGRGYDDATWQQIVELGLTGVLIPDEHGGLGLGIVEASIALEEFGRTLFTTPFLASAVSATSALVAAGDTTRFESLASGETIATLATAEAGGDWRATAIQTAATAAGDGVRIKGEKHFVLDGTAADLFLVTARDEAGISLYAVAADDPGVTVTAVETLDLTRKLARVTLQDAAGELVGASGDGARIATEALALSSLALAAEQLGAAQRCLSAAVEYANVREQFGQPIAQFQAVQHRCADILVEVENARSVLLYALGAADERIEGWELAISVAKVACSDALNYAAAENLHLHGGNGFSWEYPEHLYFRRARSADLLYGSPAFHRALLAESLGL
jgi:alkylation response protein AidB-like acyl-CoA dehydrogenase